MLFDGSLKQESLQLSSLSKPPQPGMSPLLAVVCWAAQPVTTGTRASLSALEFLKEMFEVTDFFSFFFISSLSPEHVTTKALPWSLQKALFPFPDGKTSTSLPYYFPLSLR
jgi:hypothetical protein